MTSGVYGIMHKTTHKWYIGVSKDIERRVKVHVYEWLTWPDNNEISRDIKRYGLLLEWSILEECQSNLFHEKEKEWVRAFDSKRNGYNIQDGGGHHRYWSK